MISCPLKLLNFERVGIIIVIVISLVIMITPVSACNLGYAGSVPVSISFHFSQPLCSSSFSASPFINQGSAIKFSQPSSYSSASHFLVNGKIYSSVSPFG
jgi:hypothetical protein